jgi:hypothetical protein
VHLADREDRAGTLLLLLPSPSNPSAGVMIEETTHGFLGDFSGGNPTKYTTLSLPSMKFVSE